MKMKEMRSWNLLILMLSFVVGVLVGCGDDSPGDRNDNSGDLDAGIDGNVQDAGTEADAWTYECPASQPDGHICLRGQVRRIVDDSPVAVPGGARIQRLVPASGADRPTEVKAEAEVQEDGRFIFPSVAMYLRRDVPEGTCDNWGPGPCWPYDYDHFDLVMIGDASGFAVPRNRYGVAISEHVTPGDYVFGYYLIGNDTYDTWQDNWPGYQAPGSPPPPEPWCPLDPFSFDDVRLIVPVCYEYFLEPAPDLFPGGDTNINVYDSFRTTDIAECPVWLDPDRLSYPSTGWGPERESPASVGLSLFDPSVDPAAWVGFRCYNGLTLEDESLPAAFATVRARDGHADGHITIIHGLAHYR